VANDFIGAQLEQVSGKINAGDLTGAATQLNALTRSAPNDARIYFVGAALARKAENLPGAIEALERALDLAPKWVAAHAERVACMSLQGELRLAVKAGIEALELCGDSLELLQMTAAAADRAADYVTQKGLLERALRLAPRRVDILNAAGQCARRLGDNAGARTHFERSRELAPGNVYAISSLAMLARDEGDALTAIREWELAAKLAPNDQLIQFHIAATRGETPAAVPEEFVVSLFDTMAPNFDQHLLGPLKYGVPRRFAEVILERYPTRKMDVLDLGCGTGLVGKALGRTEGVLVGVELSMRMIDEAAKLNLYDRLHNVNLVDALASTPPEQYDVLVAADVFIYVGDIRTVIADAHKILRPGGVFMFSCERSDAGDGDFVFRTTQRYAHSEAYVRAACEAAGYGSVSIEPFVIRYEDEIPVDGFLCYAGRPA
jgi:predicted TPR repeat methyltransferase